MNAKESAIKIISRIQSEGHKAFLAGGCVRDIIIGREPKDWDVATSATPDQVQLMFTKTVDVGKSFGVVRVVDENNIITEVATFREDGDYSDKRRPDSVKLLTDEKADAARRDFTINSMFMDPVSGEIIDHFGGKADIENKIIRAVGNPIDRINEDALRMMRAVRFVSQLGFEIEDSLKRAITVYHPLISNVSWERISDEMTKILNSKKPSTGLKMLLDTYLMHRILPEVVEMEGAPHSCRWHPEGCVATHTRIVCDLIDKSSGVHMGWAALLHDIAKPDTAGIHPKHGDITHYGHDEVGAKKAVPIMERFKLSNAMQKQIVDMIALHMKMHKTDMSQAKWSEIAQRPDINDLIELQRADAMSTGLTDKVTTQYWRDRIAELSKRPDIAGGKVINYIDGKVLTELGFAPGPNFKAIIAKCREKQLSGVFSKEELIAFAKETGKEINAKSNMA